MHVRTDEIPLSATEMACLRQQIDALIKVSNLDTKPTYNRAGHICGDQPRRPFVPGVTVSPNDPNGSGKGARPNKTISCKSI